MRPSVSDDSDTSVATFLLAFGGMALVATAGVALVARGHGHRAGTA